MNLEEPLPISNTNCHCVRRIMEDGSTRGCVDCDIYWDMPALVVIELDADKQPCEGCYLLEQGLGGENQMAHACLGY